MSEMGSGAEILKLSTASPLCPRKPTSHVYEYSPSSAEAADLGFEQRPAARAQPFPPPGIDARQPRPERRLVHLVEDEAAPRQVLAQARIEGVLVDPLLAHRGDHVALDRAFDVVGKALPGRQMRHEVKARPHMVGHADISHQ